MVCSLKQLKFLLWVPFLLGIFLFVPSFAHKKIASIHLFFDFVETQMSNDCIGWFSTLKHILKGHAGMWSKLGDFYLVFVELSCVLWMLKNLEFGLWSYTMQHAIVLQDLLFAIFVFCLIWLGLWMGAFTLLLQMGKVFWD